MNQEGVPKDKWTPPYAQTGGSHTLSGSALAEMAREILAQGHSFRFLAPGTSMSPFIRNGDVVTIVPFDTAACVPGDIVAFVQPENGRLIVHRIIDVADDRCRIKGDNNPGDDGFLSSDAIIGTVARLERGGREVRFGLGPERVLIALLSRRGLLSGCTLPIRVVYSIVRRFL